jgi:hypothetical protein
MIIPWSMALRYRNPLSVGATVFECILSWRQQCDEWSLDATTGIHILLVHRSWNAWSISARSCNIWSLGATILKCMISSSNDLGMHNLLGKDFRMHDLLVQCFLECMASWYHDLLIHALSAQRSWKARSLDGTIVECMTTWCVYFDADMRRTSSLLTPPSPPACCKRLTEQW